MAVLPFNLSGVSRDLPPWRVPPDMWTDAQGVKFDDNLAERVPGSAYLYGSTLASPLHLLNSDLNGVNYWLYGADDGSIGVTDDAGSHSDISPAGYGTTDEPDQWTSTVLNGVPVMNYWTEAPVWWDRNTANVMTTLPGWPSGASAYSMRAFKEFLLAIGYNDGADDFPDQLVWSDAADPGTLPTEWTPSATNLAGSLEFGDTPGALIDGGPLRGNFLLFKQSSTFLLQFIGGNFVFSRRKLFATSGVLARNCWAEIEGNMAVFTDSDIILTDGQGARSLIDSRTRRNIFANISQANVENTYVFNNKSRDEVWFCYPTEGNTYPNQALVWNVDHDKLSFRPLVGDGDNLPHIAYGNVSSGTAGETWDTIAGSWDSQTRTWNEDLSLRAVQGGLAADFGGDKLIQVDVGDTPAVGTTVVYLERTGLDLGAPDVTKLCRRIWPRIDGDDGTQIAIQVGAQMFTDEPVKWAPAVTFTLGTDRKIDCSVQGRYLAVKAYTSENASFRMPGFDMEIADNGGRY